MCNETLLVSSFCWGDLFGLFGSLSRIRLVNGRKINFYLHGLLFTLQSSCGVRQISLSNDLSRRGWVRFFILINPIQEVTAAGYLRRDDAIKVDVPAGVSLIHSSDLSQYEGLDSEGNRMINAEILKCVIQDEEGNCYRIIPMEYKFLVKYALPLPRKHWLERMKENFKMN